MAWGREIFVTETGEGGGLISGGMMGNAERAGEAGKLYFAQDEARVLDSRDASSTRYPESWAVLTPKFIIGGGRTNKRELVFDEDKCKIEIKRLWILIIEIFWKSLFCKQYLAYWENNTFYNFIVWRIS